MSRLNYKYDVIQKINLQLLPSPPNRHIQQVYILSFKDTTNRPVFSFQGWKSANYILDNKNIGVGGGGGGGWGMTVIGLYRRVVTVYRGGCVITRNLWGHLHNSWTCNARLLSSIGVSTSQGALWRHCGDAWHTKTPFLGCSWQWEWILIDLLQSQPSMNLTQATVKNWNWHGTAFLHCHIFGRLFLNHVSTCYDGGKWIVPRIFSPPFYKSGGEFLFYFILFFFIYFFLREREREREGLGGWGGGGGGDSSDIHLHQHLHILIKMERILYRRI